MTTASAVEQFLAAITRRDADAVKRALDADPALATARGPHGQTPAILAIYRKAAEIVGLLRQRGVRLDVFEAAAGDLPRVQALIDGDSALARSHAPDGWTPLHLAAHFRHADVVELLLARGADVNAQSRNDHANAPLHAAVAGGAGAALVRRPIAAGAVVDARQRGGYTALHEAAATGNADLVRVLLEAGADPSARTDEGRTPAALAGAAGHDAIVQALADGMGRRPS